MPSQTRPKAQINGIQTTSPFFAQFPDFTPDPKASLTDDFHRLAAQRGWKHTSKRWRKMWSQCVSFEYDYLIGSTLASLESWRLLCVEVGLGADYPSITKCKAVCSVPFRPSPCLSMYGNGKVDDDYGGGQALSKVSVNIIDLLDSRRAGTQVRTFKSRRQLAEYSKEHDKIFNRNVAKQDKLLRVLLRPLF